MLAIKKTFAAVFLLNLSLFVAAQGTQFITGPCTSDADCASGCCGFNTGKCAGPVIAQERDGGCGFGDPFPNDRAAQAFRGAVTPGTQFITGVCSSDADCASGCCGFNTGKCAGAIIAQERDGGCGFGDSVPNDRAAQALRGGQASPPPAAPAAPARNAAPAVAPGSQFITGPCNSDADCASGCCGFNTGKCAGAIVAQERDGGCGFGDAQPNDIAAQRLRDKYYSLHLASSCARSILLTGYRQNCESRAIHLAGTLGSAYDLSRHCSGYRGFSGIGPAELNASVLPADDAEFLVVHHAFDVVGSMPPSNSTAHQQYDGGRSTNFLSNAIVHNTGNINNTAGDFNLNNYYYLKEVSPREKLLRCSCTRAMFNGDIRVDTPKCRKETQKSIVTSIRSWAVDINSDSYIHWLGGSVGTGKSAIARQICKELDEEDPALLAGSFFWRNDDGRNSLKAFVATIAYHISVVIPDIGRVIEDVIRQLLDLLIAFHKRGLGHRFAFLISSRPEIRIQTGMDVLSSEYPTSFLPSLMLSETEESREDMRLILTSDFQSIHRSRRAIIGNRQWPPRGSINRIITLAQGQFIYVLTILRWLDDDEGHPVDRLDSILGTSRDGKARAFAPLDRLYDLILASACSKEAGDLVLPCLLLITGSRHFRVRYLEGLGELFQKQPDHLRIVLQPLHSILSVPDRDWRNIEVYHTSFVEYLHDASRSDGCHIFKPDIINILLQKAIQWANRDEATHPQHPTLWLEVHAFFPEGTILFTPDLWSVVSQMNAKHWLRLHLLFQTFDWLETGRMYNQFRQWFIRCIPDAKKRWLSDNFPDDLFPPAGSNYQQHLLRDWVNDCKAGILSPREAILLLCALFSFSVAEFARDHPSFELQFESIVFIVDPCIASGNFLPSDLHTCRTRGLYLSLQQYPDTNHLDWNSFLRNAVLGENFHPLSTLFRDSDVQGTVSPATIVNTTFTPMDILYSFVISRHANPYNDEVNIWKWWKIIHDSQPESKGDPKAFMVLRGFIRFIFLPRRGDKDYPRDVREELVLFIEYFGDIAPPPLLDYWKHPKLIDFSESTVARMISFIDEETGELPLIRCKCDEFLAKCLEPVPSCPAPDWTPTISGDVDNDDLHDISSLSTLFGFSSIALAFIVDHLMSYMLP
ncbi:hypothetical protein AX16_000928 [Volvariella volvacea WC 439]|nr:hypothetical protein AX16_000928 [Volvariella volvacea WC 439]